MAKTDQEIGEHLQQWLSRAQKLFRSLITIDYVSTFSLVHEHVFSFKRASVFSQSFEVSIDGQRVLQTRAESTLVAQSHSITIEDTPVELLWKWSHWRGEPLYIVLRQGSQILVKYGSDRAIAKLEAKTGTSSDHASNIVALRLLDDVSTSDQVEEVGRDEFPLDNSFGSEALSVEQEISRTISSNLSITNRSQIEAQLKAGIFSVVEVQLSSHLESVTNHTIAETLTRRQKVAFSVKAGQSVLYTILWKARRRSGNCTLSADGKLYQLHYAVRYGLSFEINSNPR